HQARSEEQVKLIERGGYVLADAEGGTPDVILIGTGSEVSLAMEAKAQLDAAGIRTRVVSMPASTVFDRQDEAYRESVLPKSVRKRVAVEAGITDFWRKYVGLDGAVIGLDRFGASAPAGELYKYFNITTDAVVAAARALGALAVARPGTSPGRRYSDTEGKGRAGVPFLFRGQRRPNCATSQASIAEMPPGSADRRAQCRLSISWSGAWGSRRCSPRVANTTPVNGHGERGERIRSQPATCRASAACPVSSSSSRAAAPGGVSPGSIQPPGSSSTRRIALRTSRIRPRSSGKTR